MEFPGQGSDPSCSCDLSCSRGHTRSLTHCAGRGIEPYVPVPPRHCQSRCATAGTPRTLRMLHLHPLLSLPHAVVLLGLCFRCLPFLELSMASQDSPNPTPSPRKPSQPSVSTSSLCRSLATCPPPPLGTGLGWGLCGHHVPGWAQPGQQPAVSCRWVCAEEGQSLWAEGLLCAGLHREVCIRGLRCSPVCAGG